MIAETLHQLENLARSIWEREAERRLATLRMIPSTDMRWFLDQYDGLDPREQELLRGGLSRQAACVVAGVPFVQFPVTEPQAALINTLRERNKNTRWKNWKYSSLRSLKMMMLWEDVDEDWLPEHDAERIRATVSSKATDLRKALRPVLQGHGYVQTSKTAGDWRWSTAEADGFEIRFDFGGMDSQLRYEARPAKTRDSPLRPHAGFGFEGILGMTGFCTSHGDWDVIEVQQVEETAALVGHLLDQVIAFLRDAEAVMRPVS